MPDRISHRQDGQTKRKRDTHKPDANVQWGRSFHRNDFRCQNSTSAPTKNQPKRTEQLSGTAFSNIHD
jgi:hypothetical protein